VSRFIAAKDDDFYSAAAFAVVHDLVREGNRMLEGAQKDDAESREGLVAIVESFHEITSVLGFRFPSQAGDNSALTAGLLDYLLELREDARKEKAFERADAIRDRIAELGVQVEDTASGPRWRIDAGGA
jgi:cysteinyl-tRNA synthetase